MAVTIDATTGGANANSYVTLAEADIYFATRLNSTTFTSTNEDNRSIALIMATQRIDFEAFVGDRASSTQALAFPRSNLDLVDGIQYESTEIPPHVKKATYELALYMLDTDMSAANSNDAYNSVSIGPLNVSFTDNQPSNNTLPPYVKALLCPFSELNLGVLVCRG